jgi:hypothetical protein
MAWTKVRCSCLALALTVCATVECTSTWASARYTARALVKVLPYVDKDPLAIATPPIDKGIQYGFRVSMATLMRQPTTLIKLLRMDEIRQTKWSKEKDGEVRGALRDLQKNLQVHPQPEGDYIEVSMTSGDAQEAALIVTKLIRLFVESQKARQRQGIAGRLTRLEERRARIEQDLAQANRALDEVRQASGFTDLQEHDYPHWVTARLIRLQEQSDELALQIAGLRTVKQWREKHEENVGDVELELAVLQGRYEELRKLLTEATAKKRDLDLARIQYRLRAEIRNERQERLNEIKQLIEKLRILFKDPDIAKLQPAGRAPEPLEES